MAGVTKIAKELAAETRNDHQLEQFWANRRQQNSVIRSARRVEDFASPGCPSCGYPSELGHTATGRKAWFCNNMKCQFFDTAVVSVIMGVTDTVENYKKLLWKNRMNTPFYQVHQDTQIKRNATGQLLTVAWKTEVGC